MTLLRFASYILIGIFIASPNAHAFGEAQKPVVELIQNPLTTQTRIQPSRIEAGGTAEIIIDMKIAPNYHAYLERFKLAVESPDDLKLADFKITPVVRFLDGATKTEKDGVENSAQLRALFEVPTGFKNGAHTAKLKFTYQACTADHCLFPKTLSLDASFDVHGGSATIPLAKAATDPTNISTQLASGLLSTFFFVLAMGFLTSLTPCIYPMIPITLAVLGARAKTQSHAKNFSIALTYVLGIAFTYSLLGVVAATTGGLFGSALSNVYVVSGIALVFVAMGLSMFGVFELQAPAFIRNKVGTAKTTTGYGGAFATGLIAGIVASPCIGPVLVGLLAYIAQTKSTGLGFSLLFTFAMGMGVPFIVLGMSSSLISKLPKAGSWMDGVKYLFGLVMIGMAFYYIKPIYPTWLFDALLGVALVLLASAFGAYAAAITPRARLQKGLMQMMLVAGITLTVCAILTRTGSLPAATTAQTPRSLLDWKPYSQAALEAAKGQPVLIDFTAEWCGACKEMESTVFVDPRIVEISRRFTLLKVDGTQDSPELQAVIEKFKVQGFPTYIFIDATGKVLTDLTVIGAFPVDGFHQRMITTSAAATTAAN